MDKLPNRPNRHRPRGPVTVWWVLIFGIWKSQSSVKDTEWPQRDKKWSMRDMWQPLDNRQKITTNGWKVTDTKWPQEIGKWPKTDTWPKPNKEPKIDRKDHKSATCLKKKRWNMMPKRQTTKKRLEMTSKQCDSNICEHFVCPIRYPY